MTASVLLLPGSHSPLWKAPWGNLGQEYLEATLPCPCGRCRCGVKSSVTAERRGTDRSRFVPQCTCREEKWTATAVIPWVLVPEPLEEFRQSSFSSRSFNESHQAVGTTATHHWLCWQKNGYFMALAGLLSLSTQSQLIPVQAAADIPCATKTGHGMCAGSLWKLWGTGRFWHNVIIHCLWPQCVRSTENEQHFLFFLNLCTL